LCEKGDFTFGERLDLLRSTTGWLRREPEPAEEVGCWLLHNLNRPLLDQATDLWSALDGTRVAEAVVISPYFDRSAQALAELLRRLQPGKLTLVTEYRALGVDPARFRERLDASNTQWDAISPNLDGRRLHAKAIALSTERGTWLLTGSPNFSYPALLSVAGEGNAELAVLRYEPGSELSRSFLGPIHASSSPLALDWQPRLEGDDTTASSSEEYRILSADLSGTSLSIMVEPPIPEGARLRVDLRGFGEHSFEPEEWIAEGDTVVLEVPEDAASFLSGPCSLALSISFEGKEARSAHMAVHDRETIRNNSQPVRYRARPRVPASLLSLGTAQHLDLLEQLDHLFATNPQQLRQRRGISSRAVRELELEESLATEEDDYNPEAMIVKEKIEAPQVSGGLDLYVDYDDRTLYQDIMAALRAVVYSPPLQPARRQGEDEPGSARGGEGPSQSGEHQPQPRTEEDTQRVTRSFSRLVGNFEAGLRDIEYLSEVPPVYLKELFYVLTTYLRLLRLERLVAEENLLDLSERLFRALLGEGEEDGWEQVATAVDTRTLDQSESETHYWKQAWLHLYLLADLCVTGSEERLPQLAVLLRRATRQMGPPDMLCDLPNDFLDTVWRRSIYRDVEPRRAEEIAGDLTKYSQQYDERTLLEEVRRAALTYPTIERTHDWSTTASVFTIVGPWHDKHLDYYWRVFRIFCTSPKLKKTARLVFKDANTAKGQGEDHRLVLFYRNDRRTLAVQVNPINGEMYRGVLNAVFIEEVAHLPTFSDVIDHRNAVTLVGSKPPMVNA
jgi:hypothetical protein